MKSDADYRRSFWALFLGSTVQKDGQVPGFSRWYDSATPWVREEATSVAYWAAIKIGRGDRDPDECLASGVRHLRSRIHMHQGPEMYVPSSSEVSSLVSTICSAFSDDRPAVISTPRPSPADESYFR